MTITINQFAILLVIALSILIVSIANLIMSIYSRKKQEPRQNMSELKDMFETISGRNVRNFMPHEARRLMRDQKEKDQK
jgi:hypothetical protein